MIGRQARAELGDRAAREAEDPGEPDVDVGRPDDRRTVGEVGLLAGQQPGAAHAVAADVHERAALQVGPQPDVGRIVEDEAERRPDRLEPPDLGQELEEPPDLRVVAPHEALGQDEPGPLGQVERGDDLVGPARVRLLAQDVLPGRERPHRPGVVERVRQADVDRLDERVLEEVVVARVGPGDPVLGGEGCGPLGRPAADRDDRRLARPVRPGDELRADPGRAEDPPADRRLAPTSTPSGLRPARTARSRARRGPARSRATRWRPATARCGRGGSAATRRG